MIKSKRKRKEFQKGRMMEDKWKLLRKSVLGIYHDVPAREWGEKYNLGRGAGARLVWTKI
jgi:hypothetical protein